MFARYYYVVDFSKQYVLFDNDGSRISNDRETDRFIRNAKSFDCGRNFVFARYYYVLEKWGI